VSPSNEEIDMLVVAITVYPTALWEPPILPVPLIARTQAMAVAATVQHLRETYDLDYWDDVENIVTSLMAATTYEELKTWLRDNFCALDVTYNEVDL
jgi:hypothetical protein